MDQILKFSVARLLTSSTASSSSPASLLAPSSSSTVIATDCCDHSNGASGSNDDATTAATTTTTRMSSSAASGVTPQNFAAGLQQSVAFSQALYDSVMLNALLLLDNNHRQASHTQQQQQQQSEIKRSFVEFYQPSNQQSANSHDRLLLAIADGCQSSSASTATSQQSLPFIGALAGSSTFCWQPSTSVGFHDTPPLRPRKAAPRAVFSMLQRRGLERYFQQHKYISRTERRRISATLGLTDVQVKIWFQNRRMKWRQNSAAPELSELVSQPNNNQQALSGDNDVKKQDNDPGCSGKQQIKRQKHENM